MAKKADLSTPPAAERNGATTTAALERAPNQPVDLKTRFVCALQSTGRVGKSTALQGIASWLEFAGVPWAGVDADPEHTTFSDVFTSVAHFPLTTADSLDKIFRHADYRPVCLVDFPAGATDQLLDHIERRQVLAGFREKGVRMTVLLFASPDPTAEESFRRVFTALRGEVDFMLVHNDARYSSARFDASRAAATLADLATPPVTLPARSTLTLREVAAAEAKLRRRLSLAEAREHVGTDSRLDLDYFTGRVWQQLEDCAERIVPDPAAIGRRVERAGSQSVRAAAYDRFTDPLDL